MIQVIRQVIARLEGSRAGRFFGDTAHAVRGLVHGFRGESLTLRAGNLTFITITSLIPLVGVAMAFVQLFRARELEDLLRGFVRDLLVPGVREQSDQLVQIFVNATASRTLGGLSFVILLFSAGILLRHLDASLNEVWAVRRRRPLGISIALYAGLLIVGPILTAVSLMGTHGLRSIFLALELPFSGQAVVLGGTAVAVAVLTVLYKVAPHAPVRLRSAFAGGLVAGVSWDVARHTYSGIAGLAFSANPVYGSLGIAPLFLMWIYVSWLVVLFGARLSYAVEHAGFRGTFIDILMHPRARELVAARIAQVTARAFLDASSSPTVKLVAQKLSVPEQLVEEIVHQLEARGLLVVSRRGELKPARDPSLLTLADLSAAVGGVVAADPSARRPPRPAEYSEFEKLFSLGDDASVQKLSQISWTSLASEPTHG